MSSSDPSPFKSDRRPPPPEPLRVVMPERRPGITRMQLAAMIVGCAALVFVLVFGIIIATNG